jgi:hypothetical protein
VLYIVFHAFENHEDDSICSDLEQESLSLKSPAEKGRGRFHYLDSFPFVDF